MTQEYVMTGTGMVAIPPQAMPEEAQEIETIQTRFGQVTIYRKNPIVFPNGMLGLPDKFSFCLTKFPSEKLARFKLLQSLEDMELSFITLPLEMDNAVVERKDIEQACKDLEIASDDLTLLLVVTVHRTGNGVKLSVNARAPIFINTTRRVASQYVFHNTKYNIQHMITL